MAITLEKLEIDYLKAKEAYEEAEKELSIKKEEFKKIKTKRNKRICKEFENLFSSFWANISYSEIFFDAFYELQKLGIDSEDVLFQDFDDVKLIENYIVLIQIHVVEYDQYTHEIKIPTSVSYIEVKKILETFIQKEKELKEKEEKEQKAKRYQLYLKLKEEFESP